MKRASLLLAVLLLTACTPAISEGTIKDKHHKPDESGYQVQYGGCGISLDGKGMCEPGLKYVYVSNPERWSLYIEHCDQLSNECRLGWLSVSQATYDAYQVGEHYPRSSSS